MIELTTERLTLREILGGDLDCILEISQDPRVMHSLGGTRSPEQCEAWLARELQHWQRHGYGRYFVAQKGRFIGFVGLSRSDFDHGLVPGVEVAWHLAFAEWGRGYATEAARAAIAHGFAWLGLSAVIAVTSAGNTRSRRVMERLGMRHSPHEQFEHPRLAEGYPLRTHVVYRLDAPQRNQP